jgi:hypothetical protein
MNDDLVPPLLLLGACIANLALDSGGSGGVGKGKRE